MMGGPQQHLQAGTVPPTGQGQSVIGSFDQVNPGTAMDQKAALAGNTNSEAGSYLVNREYQRRVEDIMRDGTPRNSAMQKETKTLDEVKGQHPWETPYLNQKQSERKT